MPEQSSIGRCDFPVGFTWGVATSACQVEGGFAEDGKGPSIWDVFCRRPGAIKNEDNAEVACDHYHRYAADVEEMADIGITSYRFSISWPRILPNGHGRPNPAGIDFYKKLLDRLAAKKIVPNVTMYHWDLPESLQSQGGWATRDIVNYFDEYANVLYDNFMDQVPLWTTFNEPRLVYEGYTGTVFAPGLGRPELGKRVIHNILLSHGAAVQSLIRRRTGKESQIGIVIDIWDNQPARPVRDDEELASRLNDRSFHVFLSPLFHGRYPGSFLQDAEFGEAAGIHDKDMDIIRTPMDFLGINCYSRSIVSTDRNLNDVLLRKQRHPERFAALNMEIYPQAIYNACRLIHDRYSRSIPIYITENGCPMEHSSMTDANLHDHARIRYISSYLTELNRAIREGIQVRGYYVWSLLDNFEWSYGYSIRCGIIYVDFVTQRRIWKESAHWYRQVVLRNGLEDALPAH